MGQLGEASFYGDTLRRFINLALWTLVHGQRSHQEYIPASKLRSSGGGVRQALLLCLYYCAVDSLAVTFVCTCRQNDNSSTAD